MYIKDLFDQRGMIMMNKLDSPCQQRERSNSNYYVLALLYPSLRLVIM